MNLKKMFLSGLLCVLLLPASRLMAAEVNWDFSQPGAADGWTGWNVADKSVADGVWTIRASRGCPVQLSPEVKIDAANQPVVNFRMKVAKGLVTGGLILFVSDAAPNWDDKTMVSFQPFSDGEWHDYEVDMSKSPYWKGTVKQLRFQPIYIADSALTAENAIIQLKYFRVPSAYQWPSAAGAIKNKRVAIFFEPGFPGGTGVKDLLWYQENLKEFGLTATVVGAAQISDPKFLTKKSFDTLILPGGAYLPFEAGYSVCNFLAEGGSVITGALPRCVKYSAEKKQWDIEKKPLFESEAYEKDGVPIEFQIRTFGQKQSLDSSPKLNPALRPMLSTDLALMTGSFKREFLSLNTINMVPGEFGPDPGEDTALSANIILPVYLLSGGQGTDFVGLRYHNVYFNGATLVHLGVLGSCLLDSPYGKNVLHACLKLCETEFPQEQEPAYYQRLIVLQKEASALDKEFVETSSRLRDIALRAFCRGKQSDFTEAQKKMSLCEEGLSFVMREKQSIDKLLLAGSDPKGQDERRTNLLARIQTEKQRLKEIRNEAERGVRQIDYPGDVKIESPFGGIQIEAGMTSLPTLYTMRKDFFQTMKELGANVHYCQAGWAYVVPFLDDPAVKENSRGLTFNTYCNPAIGQTAILPSPGEEELNPATGEVTQNGIRRIPTKEGKDAVAGRIQAFTADWKDWPVARAIIVLYEDALQANFWGKQARMEYLEYLQKKYNTVEALNQSWSANYKDFAEIQLVTKSPETIAQHGNFQDWIDFREEMGVSYLAFLTDAIKKYNPGMPVSVFAGGAYGINSPLYGLNFYRDSKIGDIHGIDTTYGVPPQREWIWFDLSCGKPVLTAEWSAFYGPPESIIMGRNKLCEEAWTIISGGSVGLNLWIWRWGGFRGDFVDMTGVPTLYGWELKSLVSDFRRFDHIILDGKRKEPEVRILFSNASRVHNQTWKKNWCEFDPNASPHVTAAMNLYGLFLWTQQPARVIDEQAVLEGADLSSCKLLIVPQAEYLSDATQRILLAYAQAGGNLMLEGKSGAFNNYGRPTNLLFKQAGIIPSAVERKEVMLDGKIIPVANPENAFAVSLFAPEKGKTLLSYASGEPAVVSVSLGKGRVLVSGAPFSLDCTDGAKKSASLIMDQVYQEIALSSKYVCSDRNLILREWEYKGDDYLICVYPKTGEEKVLKEFQLKIKGNWKANNYLLGTEISSSFDGNYTRFSCLISSPGGCVYKLNKGTASVTKAPRDVKTKEQVQAGPAESGKAQKIKNQILSSACSLEQKDGMLVLANGLVRIKILPDRGARIVEYATLPDGVNHLAPPDDMRDAGEAGGARAVGGGGETKGGIAENNGWYPGSFFNQRFSYKILENTSEQVKVLFEMDNPSNDGVLLKKTVWLRKNEAKMSLDLEERNCKNAPAPLVLYLYPELRVGGTADKQDIFFMPTPKGSESFAYSPYATTRFFTPSAGWMACCDVPSGESERIACVFSFPLDGVKETYFALGTDRYSFVLGTPQKQTEVGKSLSLYADLFLVKGLSGIDVFNNGVAANIILSGSAYSQEKDINGAIEISNALFNKQGLKGEVDILKAGQKVKTVSEFSPAVSYGEPFAQKMSVPTKGLADGEYEIALSLSDDSGKQILTAAKPFVLIGEKFKAYAGLKERLAQMKKAKSADAGALFDASVAVEEFRMSLERNDYKSSEESLSKAEALVKKVED